MKKHLLIPLSLGMVFGLAACNNSSNTPNQAQVDSMVNARVATMEAQQKAQNDSMINAMAKMKADSMMGVKSTTSKTTHTVAAPPQGAAHTNKGNATQAPTTNTTPTAPTNKITEEQKKQQDTKFNER